ncbi:PadR family transcriptional regulator [Actinokineospora sp.]|uniref:PadR family transcriptional regulator n=1 Tax=Actinokineospora sp. TaxID=1872133 RepID=UPI0040380FED
MSATRMLVLGVIHWAGKAHGYQVRAELIGWRAEDWARIKPGSIYHAIRKAAADGLIETVSAEPGQGGPDRTAYRITEAGDAELLRLIREGLRRTRDPWMLNAALAMLPLLGRDDAKDLVGERIERLATDLADLEHWVANPEPDTPDHVREQATLWIGLVSTEITWAKTLLARLDDGAYEMAGEKLGAHQV